MVKKLKTILLVDDDKATNFINKRVIKKTGCADEVLLTYNGIEALELLTTPVNGTYIKPDLILLDVNMPKMNGWEFMEEYAKLSDEQKGKIVIIMLTTSLNPSDREKAEEIKEITAFEKKPLSEEVLLAILAKYFE